ncbi:MAG: aminoacyl-histidine dipeptidase [Spirochaetaceae bacterium]|nr:MAG: aminoacyl-histidine dipeptidase [Spirochaetaceae bacterium]
MPKRLVVTVNTPYGRRGNNVKTVPDPIESRKGETMERTTERVCSLFEMMCAVPRPSRKEEKIRTRLIEWATDRGWETRVDPAGNLLIRVPATAGCEAAPVVVLQGHMDMVCEKRAGSTHNFDTDPIRTRVDGEWLTAVDTTLGADNGIALALALSIGEDETIRRPPLELLFTVDEESGLTGATQLASDLLSGSVLINLDSEDDGRFTVGCAGGVNVVMQMPIDSAAAPAHAGSDQRVTAWRVAVSGLTGGHSGVDIHTGRANALGVLALLLKPIAADPGFHLSAISGGNAHNAIPREASAEFVLPAGLSSSVVSQIATTTQQLQHAFRATDPNLAIEAEPLPGPRSVARSTPGSDAAPTYWSHTRSRALVELLSRLPNGPSSWSTIVPDLVETSANLALVRVDAGHVTILVSLRGSDPDRLQAAARDVTAVAEQEGASVSREAAYPGWKPDPSSDVLQRALRVYRNRFQAEAVVEVVHAGLECGVIGAKYPHMQMVSLGPTIVGPHSPDERLHLPSVGRVRQLLVDLLEDYCR